MLAKRWRSTILTNFPEGTKKKKEKRKKKKEKRKKKKEKRKKKRKWYGLINKKINKKIKNSSQFHILKTIFV
jgi:hypothetical protein